MSSRIDEELVPPPFYSSRKDTVTLPPAQEVHERLQICFARYFFGCADGGRMPFIRKYIAAVL
jgi:hypothetical protein